jgi:hypothetical protein
MTSYKPQAPFSVPMRLLIPTSRMVKGTRVDTFEIHEKVIFGSFRTFGGTDNFSNGVYTVESTGIIDTWYNPLIKSDCRILICETEEEYEIISQPENIDMRNQYMQFKVQRVGGKP